MNIEERKQKAKELHGRGYNCAQCVVMAFGDITGIEDEISARMAMGLGGGVGAQGEICGVITGMAIADGLMGSADPSEKPAANKRVRAMSEEFKGRNCGMCRCWDLKKGGRSCDDLIAEGVEILGGALKI